ncbi:MAG TPA: M48 family metalloprotease [Candidatus Baltobacteraceae bacterium]|nr:M48 family metalloprotease [Candidatus Baltobacteraceae bacterium]
MRRLLVALLLGLALLGASRAPALAARTRLDARIDALTPRELLTRNAAVLVDPGRQRRARAIADLTHGASAGWALAQILGFWWLWRSGAAARLRDAMRRRTRSRLAQRAVFGAAIGVLAPLVSLPFAFLSYRVGFNAGTTEEHVPQWFLEYLVRIGLDAIAGALVVAGVLWLVDTLRGRWYLVVAAVLYAGTLIGVAAAPMLPGGPAEKTTPREVAALGAEVARAVGVPGTPVIVVASSRHSNAMASSVAGAGPTARVLLGDLALVHLLPGELRFVLAQAFERIRAGAVLRQTVLAVTLFIFSAAIAVFLSDRVGFRRDDDAVSRLALVATFLGLVLVVTYPIYTTYARRVTGETDALALAATHDRADAVRSLVRYADDDLLPLCDRRSLRWYFDDRPPLGARIAAIAGTPDPCPGGDVPAF